ncbi:MAG: ECF RNA polymerase sigma factor SigK [Gemmatimonadaceae bacterium]|nr:ECF RNA polymerase sigma factor SigK [Gemmatimonadaceae bacterium]
MTGQDRQLLDRLRGGSEQAFEEIFRTWYATLVRIAGSLLREQERAEEVVQEVLLEFWRRREQLSGEGSAHAYLIRSTRNRSLNALRHDRVRKRDAQLLAGSDVSPALAFTELEGEEIGVALNRAIAALPDRCREVFLMSRKEGLKYSEIARALGVSVKTVEAHMGRALRLLRESMAPWLPSASTK